MRLFPMLCVASLGAWSACSPRVVPPVEEGLAEADSGSAPTNDGGAPAPDAGPLDCNTAAVPRDAQAGRWDARFTLPGLSGPYGIAPYVYDFARSSQGELLAVGSFEFAGTERVGPAVRLREGRWEPLKTQWELPLPPSGFSAIAVGPAGELALASHDDFGERSGQIWMDDGTGLKVIGAFTGLVRELVFFGGKLWMAGDFALTPSGPSHLAVWDGRVWTRAPGGAPNQAVYALYPEGTSLFVAGRFTRVGGIAAAKVAEWTGTSWKPYSLPSGLFVATLARGPSGRLVAGGALPTDQAQNVGSLYEWTGRAWALLGNGVSAGSFAGVVTQVLPFQGKLIVAGCFSSVNGAEETPGSVPVQALASWNGTGWEALEPESAGVGQVYFTPLACGDENRFALWSSAHQRLFSDEEKLWVGGSIPGLGGVASQSVVSFDGRSFGAQQPAGWGLSGALEDVAVGGPRCRARALGNVTHAGTERLSRTVLEFNEGWSPVGPALPENVLCAALAVAPSGRTAVGCNNREPDPETGELAGRVFELRDNNWAELNAGALLPFIQDLAFDSKERLWIGGGSQSGLVSRLNADNRFEPVGPGFDGSVFRLDFARDGSDALVVGGAFTHVGMDEVNRIARWDGANWTALGSGLSTFVLAVEYGSDAIYASTQDEGTGSRTVVAKWNGTQWTELATPAAGFSDITNVSFNSLVESGGRLLAAGTATLGDAGSGVFLYDGTAFHALGGGVNAIRVESVALAPDSVWVAGAVTSVGPSSGRVPSSGVARFQLAP